jgi:FKBP-type peptidyl-prolyl cis-trans isomerase SlyD
MEKIQPGKYVELGYDLYAVEPNGTEKLVHQTDASDPEKIIFGVTRGMIEPLEKAIEGLEKDGKFNVTATADEAFGPYDPEQIVTLDKELFLIDDKFDDEHIKVGEYVPMMTADGFRINGLVKEVTDSSVKMDFNHPLAGKAVRFDGKILTVRDATPDELKPAGGCCGGGCGDNCSCEGGCEGGCQ